MIVLLLGAAAGAVLTLGLALLALDGLRRGLARLIS